MPTYQETRGTQSILSTLNGPSGLLIGERNSNQSTYPLKQTKSVSLVKRDEQRIHPSNVSNNYQSTAKIIDRRQIWVSQDQQSIVFNESMDFIPNTERRVLIDDQFYRDKGSVFDRLGSNSMVKRKV